MTIKVFSPDYLESLVQEATTSPRLRQHRNVHTDHADLVQRTFNAIGISSYLRPHRHALVPRTETMIAVRGLMALIEFDDEGAVLQVVRFGAGRVGEDQGVAAGVETPPGYWHTVVALVPRSVLLEIKAGPFDSSQPKEFAAWAPAEGSAEAAAYLERLRQLISARYCGKA